MNDNQPPIPEFSRPFDLRRLGDKSRQVTIEADPNERDRLSERLELLGVHALAAELSVERLSHRGLYRVSGRVTGEIDQTCAVTMEAVRAHVSEPIEEFLIDAESRNDEENGDFSIELDLDPEAETPEPILDHMVDLGELVTQVLSLAVDPYARTSGAEPGMAVEAPPGVEFGGAEKASAFAGLAELRDRLAGKG